MRSPWGRYRPVTTGYIAHTQQFSVPTSIWVLKFRVLPTVTPRISKAVAAGTSHGGGVHGSSRGALWENIKQKQKRCFSPARLARTHRTGRTHSLVLFSPPTSLFAHPLLDEIHTSACARRCAHGSSWCTRCRPATSSSRCSCSLPWRWQVVELDPQRPAALLARLSTVECGKLDALVKVAWWCKRQQRIPAEQPAAKGRTLPAMAAAIAPTAAVTRQVRV